MQAKIHVLGLAGWLTGAVLAVAMLSGCGQEAGGQDAAAEVSGDVGGLEVGEVVEPIKGDPDGDGFTTEKELAYGTDPHNAASSPPDMDGDKLPDPEDDDLDGDGTLNDDDAFPYDKAEAADTDKDGSGDNVDPDDDGDGFSDEMEKTAGTDPLSAESHPADLDGDGVPDDQDQDKDGDGVDNASDAFAADPMEWLDTDADGKGDNADGDDDDDGYADTIESKYGTDPKNGADHPTDLDADGIPDGEDLDMDGDGVDNPYDLFPQEAAESADTDLDGQGNNADTDDDGDGYADLVEQKYGTDPLAAASVPADVDKDLLPDEEDSDIDGDGTLNPQDAFPMDPKEVLDTDGDGTGDNKDADDDGDAYPDWVETAAGTNPKDGNEFPGDLDEDGIPDKEDMDIDGDGFLNAADAFPYDPAEWLDTDKDGTGNVADTDDDGDSYPDAVELDLGFDPLDAALHPNDMDQDGTPDAQDLDIDGDGVENLEDAFAYDPTETIDTDGDAQGDNADLDDDDDGYADTLEKNLGTNPLDALSAPGDVDGDLIPDGEDTDADGDGFENTADAFPLDPTEFVDLDKDGVGDGKDEDDDGDSYADAVEIASGTDPKDAGLHPLDLDGDGTPDPADPDMDGDDVPNGDDAFPLDPAEFLDTDTDGKGNVADLDDDGDGYPDAVELDAGTDPLDAEKFPDDLDKDGLADTDDPDLDGDGVPNAQDAFAKDPAEWLDTDGDLTGNNGDLDDDGDGYADDAELLFLTDPLSPFSYPADLDGDKIPDAIDPDRDGDGFENAADAFPANKAEWLDTDGDGLGNNGDLDDDGDGFKDDLEILLGYDPSDFKSHPADLDGDGLPDVSDPDIDGDGFLNVDDAFPGNPIDWFDTDKDGQGDNSDLDDDGDGFADLMELEFGTDGLNPLSFPLDMDGDKIPDLKDPDIDGDLVKNDLDAFPLDPAEWLDTDGDLTGNNADLDDDGDGYLDLLEAKYFADPLDEASFPPDIDHDFLPDPEDADRDGDGVLNINDAFPDNPEAWEEIIDEGSFGSGYQDAIPDDADPTSYDTKRFSILRGKAVDSYGTPLEGVMITVLEHPEYGTVTTDKDGEFTAAVNGGLTLALSGTLDGYTEVQRNVNVPWNDMVVVDTMQFVPRDPVETEVFLSGDPDEVLVHTNEAAQNPVSVALTGDNLAVVQDEEGNLDITDSLVITATSYEVPEDMPAFLPSTSEFTYCVDMKAEGYENVEFDKPVVLWTRNDLGFDVGIIVPTGYYDRAEGKWKPMNDGVVVKLLDLDEDGLVDALDADGDGNADDLNGDGLLADEVLGVEQLPDAKPGDTYWRVPVTHFSPIDMNWPASGPPSDAEPPPDDDPDADDPDDDPDDDDPCKDSGYSEVEIRSRVLHENIPIPGTDFTLHYSSAWVPGYSLPITIPVSGETVPKSLSKIFVKYSIAGRAYSQTLPPGPKQSVEFLWDGRDFQGNLVNQRMTLTTDVGFDYPASYYGSRASAQAVGATFAAMGIEATGINAFRPVTLWRKKSVPVYRLRPETPAGAWSVGEGWSPSTYHYYDGSSQSALLGDGSKIKGDQFGIAVGSVTPSSLPSEARMVEVDSQGILYYVAKGNPTVEKQVWKLAPGGNPVLYATMASRVGDIAVGPDDNLYVTVGSYLWKIPRSTASPVMMASLYLQFFNCFAYFGDYCVLNVDIDEWGYAFLVSRYPAAFGSSYLALVAPDGTVLANPVDLQCAAFDVAVGFGGLMVAACKNGPVKKIERDGAVSTYGGWAPNCTEFYGYTDPTGVDVLADGSILIADEKCNRLRKILSDGTVTTVAGDGTGGFAGDGGGPLAAQLKGPSDVVMGPDKAIYIADAGNKRIRKVERVKSVVQVDEGQTAVPLSTNEILIFGEKLEHVEARDMMTGMVIRAFQFGATGVLEKEVFPSGKQVEFQADAQGQLTTITGVNGEETTLGYDLEGRLVSITYPDGAKFKFDYSEDGLLTVKTIPSGDKFKYTYDGTGRVKEVKDPRGGFTKYEHSAGSSGDIVQTTTAEGKVTKMVDQTDKEGNLTSTAISPLGGEKVFQASREGWEQQEVDYVGNALETRFGTDPRYKTRFVEANSLQTPAGLVVETSTSREYDSGQGLVTWTNVTNGDETTTIYDSLAGVLTTISPEGRVSEQSLDMQKGLLLEQTVGDLLPMAYQHDAKGRVTKFVQGTRTTQFVYDDTNRIVKTTDPVGNQSEMHFDAAGKLVKETKGDGSIWTYEYDANGNLVSLVAPGGRKFESKVDSVGLLQWVATPGGNKHSMSYNLDRELLETLYPSGDKTSNVLSLGLLQKRTVAGEVFTFKYAQDGSGRLDTATSPDGVTFKLTYDGDLITQTAYTAPFNAAVVYKFNSDLLAEKITVQGAPITLVHDDEGNVTKVNSLLFDRTGETAAVTGIHDGKLLVDYDYSGYGELAGMTWKVAGNTVYSATVEHRADGRYSAKTETIEGVAAAYQYEYDALSRLTAVLKDGKTEELYSFDTVSNRKTARSAALGPVQVNATFDNDDRLQSQGAWTATYDANGFAKTLKNGANGETTALQYRPDGRLKVLTLADGTAVEYLYDANGVRAARKVNGVLDRIYVYNSPTTLMAVLNGDGSMHTLFLYGDAAVPVAMVRGVKTYYLVHDINMSVRLVVADDGTVAQRYDYDAYGNVLAVKNGSFDAILGYGGGLTEFGLVHFGVRDYFPVLGRWLAKDPIAPTSGFNQYAYAGGDPINNIDPSGLWEIGGGFYKIIGGSLKIGYKNGHIWLKGCAGAGLGVEGSFDTGAGPPRELSQPGYDGWNSIDAGISARIPIVGGIGVGTSIPQDVFSDPCADVKVKGGVDVLGVDVLTADGKWSRGRGYQPGDIKGPWPPRGRIRKEIAQSIAGGKLAKNATKFGIRGNVSYCGTNVWRLW